MLILASQSPRRHDLLRGAQVPFTARPVDIDETPHAGDTPEMTVWRLSQEKALAAFRRGDLKDGGFLLAADTIVVRDGTVLGKPKDAEEAFAMVHSLAGRRHQVLTSVCVMDATGSQFTEITRTEVVFRPLSDDDVHAYVKTGEGMDKAGAYAAQGIGATLIDRMDGSYTNVIGLPLKETLALLARAGFRP